MEAKMIRWVFNALLCACASMLLLSAGNVRQIGAAQKGDAILGRWDLQVIGTDAPYTSWLEVTKEGAGLTGRFVGRFGSARPIKQIEFKDGALQFSLPPQYEHMKVDLVFKGTLAKGKLAGATNGEDGKELKWSGVRAPVLKPAAKQEMPGITGGALDSNEGTPGPLMFQGDHGKVWFRNIILTPAK
jgi:hypothetical protein